MSRGRRWSWISAFALVLGIALVFAPTARADEMSRMVIDVALQPDGSGIVTETRDMTVTSGTEIYIPMDNISGTEVIQFSVQEEGVAFTDVGRWDVDLSREEKAGTYGINYTTDGWELCWGIGEYGQHTYVVTYTLTNMVRQLEDGQSMYWKLFNEGTNMPPESLAVRVTGPEAMAVENTKIWGFGFPGELYFQDGAVMAESTEAFSRNHRVILLVQFLQSPFQAMQTLDMTLEEQEAQAKEGSSYGPSGEGGGWENGLSNIMTVLVPAFILFSIFLPRLMRHSAGKTSGGKLQGAPSRRELNARNKDKYHRDVPYTEGPMTDVASFLQQINVGNMEEYFNAYLLKWMKEGHIDHTTEEKGLLFKRQTSVMQLNRKRMEGSDMEARLWNMMQAAAGGDNRLDENEFSDWARTNYRTIERWKDDLSLDSQLILLEKGYLTQEEKKVLGVFTTSHMAPSAAGEALTDRLVQFRNYLSDFSLLSEREAVQVGLWDQLLIWASLYGIAEEVAKEFQNLYPQYFEDSDFTFTDLYIMSAFSNSFVSGYSSGASAAASSGMGGGTSIGGGGGSFGGGFGGGSR